jgi:hypothetical protein
MKLLAPLLHSYWYLLYGAGMTVTVAAAALVPATVLGVILALVQIFGGCVLRSAVVVYLFLIRGIPLRVLRHSEPAVRGPAHRSCASVPKAVQRPLPHLNLCPPFV